jgi:hypothetical protein
LQYGFIIISESPEGPEKDPEEALGCTVTNTEYMVLENDTHKSWRVFVFINLDQPELLMRDGLSSAERLTIEWSVANTVSALDLPVPQRGALLTGRRLRTKLCMPLQHYLRH